MINTEVEQNPENSGITSFYAPRPKLKLGDFKPIDITEYQIQSYIKERLNKKISPISIERELAKLSNLFKKLPQIDPALKEIKNPAVGYDKELLKFTDKQKEKMLSFGDTALIVLNRAEFIHRVKVGAEKAGYKIHFDQVKYYDPSIDGGNKYISLVDGMWNIAFWKRDSYAYQQEVRFLFSPGDENKDHIELDIGDISDITATHQ